jgi:AcrR family transcriptional regulator
MDVGPSVTPRRDPAGRARRQPICQQAPCRDASDCLTPPTTCVIPAGTSPSAGRQNSAVPKIAAATIAENREQRRVALLQAAAALIQRSGSFTMAEVAREVGLSRTAVYEYYSSAPELVADVLVEEMTAWSNSLAQHAAPHATPEERVHAWITGVLDYVIAGRHALLRSAGDIELPQTRRDELGALHHAVIAPLVSALTDAGDPDGARDARFVWGVVEAAITRIEAGECDPAVETKAVITFVDGALSATGGNRR